MPFPVKIKGNVDRIERRNQKIRIIDYKTGKVEPNHLIINNWEGFTSEIKHDKMIQLLCYAFMVQSYFKEESFEVGIISFKNLKAGFMPFQIKEGKDIIANAVDIEVLSEFKTQLIQLFQEIFNPDIPFTEKKE